MSKYDPAHISSDEGVPDAPTKESLEELEKQYRTTKLFNRSWGDMGEFVDLMAQPNARIEGNLDGTLNPASYNDLLIDSAITIHGDLNGHNRRINVDSVLCFDLSSCCVPVDGYFLLFIKERVQKHYITKAIKLKKPRVFAYVNTEWATLNYGQPKRKRTDRWYATVGQSFITLSPLSPKQLKEIKIKGTLSWNASLYYSDKQYNVKDFGSESIDANMYDATFKEDPYGAGDYPMPSIFKLRRNQEYDWETKKYIHSECLLELPFLEGEKGWWKGEERAVGGEIGRNYFFKINSSVNLTLPKGYKLLPYSGDKIDEVGEVVGSVPYRETATSWDDLSFGEVFRIFTGTRKGEYLRGNYECNLGLDVEEIFSLVEGSVQILDEVQHPSYMRSPIQIDSFWNRIYDFKDRDTLFDDIYTSAWADGYNEPKRFTFDEYTRKFFNRYDDVCGVKNQLTLLPQEIMVYQPKNTYGLLNKTVL